MDTEDRIAELAEKARLPDPEAYTEFVWKRAQGKFKNKIAEEIGISERTLTRWEKKTQKHLDTEEREELVYKAVKKHYK